MLKLFSKAAMLSKSVATGRATKLIHGYKSSESEKLYLGEYVGEIQKEFPEWSIDSVYVLEIPYNQLCLLMGIENKT